MKLLVTHETVYDYAPAVENALHMAYLQPVSNDHQQLISHALTIEPTPAQNRQTVDIFGNARSFFSLQAPHNALTVVSQSVVNTAARALPKSTISWEDTREYFRYQAGRQFDAISEFVFASPYCPRAAEFAEYARPSFEQGVSLLAAAKDLMERIHNDFEYESESTEINTPALEALAQRKGVCQDFAHIMIACLRAIGLPVRYVSGYLLTVAPPGKVKLKGSDASHAWVSIYVPDFPADGRWCDLDPTNNRMGWYSPGEDYITLATGRDFADVSPLRGVIHGGASHKLKVAVTVEPIEGDTTDKLTPQTQPQTQTQSQTVSAVLPTGAQADMQQSQSQS